VKEITFYLEPGASAETDWRHRANCRGASDPDVFFPIGSTGPALDQIEEAKTFCNPCPVRKACLDWAISTHQDSGVWGGLSEDERRAVIRGRKVKVLARA
jgi:WhiB family redox-sensing transcriptional regulator